MVYKSQNRIERPRRCASLQEHAPPLVVDGVDLVDLEGHDGPGQGGVELGAGARADDDVSVEGAGSVYTQTCKNGLCPPFSRNSCGRRITSCGVPPICRACANAPGISRCV